MHELMHKYKYVLNIDMCMYACIYTYIFICKSCNKNVAVDDHSIVLTLAQLRTYRPVVMKPEKQEGLTQCHLVNFQINLMFLFNFLGEKMLSVFWNPCIFLSPPKGWSYLYSMYNVLHRVLL